MKRVALVTAREAMALDTGIAEFGPVLPRLHAWQVVARVYPDVYRAYFQVAFNRGFHLQQYAQALSDLAPALTPQNQRLASALNMSGLLNLGLERYAEARAAFERAESLGSHDPIHFHADAEAVLRNYGAAQRLLSTQASTGMAGTDLEARLPEITWPLDQGQWDQGIAAAKSLAQARGDAALQKRTYLATWIGLRSYVEGAAVLPDLRALATDELARAQRPDDPDVVPSTFAALYAGGLAARLGDGATARTVATALADKAPLLGYPAIDDMLAVLQAEMALQRKSPEAAIQGLRARLDGGELGWVHVVLMRAYEQAGRIDEARGQADWVAAHRGRAYVELNSQYLLQPLNVLETNLALLHAAELARGVEDDAAAQAALRRLYTVWRTPPAPVAARMASVQDWLSQRKDRTARKALP